MLTRPRFRANALAALLAAAALTVTGSATATEVTPGLEPGNPSCEGALNVQSPAPGTETHSATFDGDAGSITITVTETERGPMFDFVSDAPTHVVMRLIVKGGNSANVYDYAARNGAFADTGLHAPLNASNPNDKFFGLSHVCFFTARATDPRTPTEPTPPTPPTQETATATTANAEASPTVSIADVEIVEGDEGLVVASFVLTLSAPSMRAVTVEYTTADGTAVAGADYAESTGSVTFAPGETTKTVSVAIVPNREDQDSRSFVVLLTGGTNVALGDPEGVGTIQDDDAPGAPEPRRSGNLDVVSGHVTFKLPGTNEFVELTDLTKIPLGTVVDAVAGTASLTMADGAGGTYSGRFSAGVFTVLAQTPGVVRVLAGSKAPPSKKAKKRKQANALFTTLRLEGGDFSVCNGKRALAAKGKPKPVRRLWGNSKGKFRTRGRHSAATIRGTRWLTSDRCDGTLTYVEQGGPVSVLDFRTGRTIELRHGRRYLARARTSR